MSTFYHDHGVLHRLLIKALPDSHPGKAAPFIQMNGRFIAGAYLQDIALQPPFLSVGTQFFQKLSGNSLPPQLLLYRHVGDFPFFKALIADAVACNLAVLYRCQQNRVGQSQAFPEGFL